MADSQGGGTRTKAAEELILRTIAAHADSLLRTARRHSICIDDAQDAYQRAIEIFMAHAQRLEPARAPGWLHVVVKREAQAIRAERRKLLAATEIDLDARESPDARSPEERLLSFDMISRSAEALKRLRPNELRALWLRAQGHSYSEIQVMTGWSYTKVNRCMTEGRRSFLERYADIESGAECERWLPVISAMVDDEASPDDVADLRPHLRNCPACRATLKALRESSTPLGAVLPVPLLVLDAGSGDHLLHTVMRLYEGVATQIHERAVHSVTKAQMLVEVSVSGKVAAVAASAAAVAGGGYASVERVVEHPKPVRKVAARVVPQTRPVTTPAAAPAVRPVVTKAPDIAKRITQPRRNEIAVRSTSKTRRYTPEFRPAAGLQSSATTSFHRARTPPPPPPPVRAASAAPEFSTKKSAPEFAP